MLHARHRRGCPAYYNTKSTSLASVLLDAEGLYNRGIFPRRCAVSLLLIALPGQTRLAKLLCQCFDTSKEHSMHR